MGSEGLSVEAGLAWVQVMSHEEKEGELGEEDGSELSSASYEEDDTASPLGGALLGLVHLDSIASCQWLQNLERIFSTFGKEEKLSFFLKSPAINLRVVPFPIRSGMDLVLPLFLGRCLGNG